MKKTGFLIDDRYVLHKTGDWHPEQPARIAAAFKGVRDSGLLEKISLIKAEPARQMWIEAVHTIQYIMRFQEACIAGLPDFDHPDNAICPDTYDIALLAAGGVLRAVDQVMEGTIDNAFCVVRPPGHHAEKDKAMGFCFFNNIAIAARYLQKQWGVKKIGIVDFDVHHGNGTEHAFVNDPTVFYYSIHQHPSFAYPGTGRDFDRGRGNGYGYTLNSPVLPGRGDAEYKDLFKKDLFPAFEQFKPDFILTSTGFDAHIDDDMSDINLTTSGYDWVTSKIVELSDTYSNGKLVSVLEGGYNLMTLPILVANHIKTLAGIND
ncbi:MAG: histone deacetylase [Desulfobacteraceae bacterium]